MILVDVQRRRHPRSARSATRFGLRSHLALEKPSLPRSCPAIRSVAGPTGAQRVAYPLSGPTGIECVKSTRPIAPPLRLVLCVSFALLTILIWSLVACSHAAIFVGFPESFPTLLIASLLVWIFCFTFLFHI